MWVDETALYLLPTLIRTYAPLGHRPVLSVPKSYEHLSVICALTEDYRLYWHCQERPYKGADIARFLSGLSKKLERKLLIIWDGARIHFSQVVKDWLKALVEYSCSLLQSSRVPFTLSFLSPSQNFPALAF